MTARGSRTPSPDPWSIAWCQALAAVGVAEERPTAELVALGAIARFRHAPVAPSSRELRDAAGLPAAARLVSKCLATFRAAAATTPGSQVERRACFQSLAQDLETEFRLDPSGPARWHLPIVGAPSPWATAAQRAEWIIECAQLDQLPPAPPRAPRPTFDLLVGDLAVAYQLVTGRQPSAATNGRGFTPPFVRFIAALWGEASDEPAPGWGAIGGALSRLSPITGTEQPQARGMRAGSAGGMTASKETFP